MGDAHATAGITLYGTTWCPDCKQAKQFLGEQRIAYTFADIENDPAGQAVVERLNNGKQIIPTIVFPDGTILVEPTNAQLAAKLGIQTTAKMRFYDLIVVGGGPTGLTAAIYAAREGLDTLVIERGGLGGQAGVTECLDNFPGFPRELQHESGGARWPLVGQSSTRHAARRASSCARSWMRRPLRPRRGFLARACGSLRA